MPKPTKALIAACQLLRSRVHLRTAGLKLPDNPEMFGDDTDAIHAALETYFTSWVDPILNAIEEGDTADLAFFVAHDPRRERIGFPYSPRK